MRIYTTGSSALWPIFIGLGVVLMILIGLGGLLLTTPLGLAILAFWGISSIIKRIQRKRYRADAYNQQTEWQRAEEETYSQSNWHETGEEKASEDVFAAYRQEDANRSIFTVEDLRNAQDVDYKEL